MELIGSFIYRVQRVLSYSNWKGVHFSQEGTSLGKIGVTGFALGLVGGFHLCLALFSGVYILYSCLIETQTHLLLAWSVFQWASYMTALCVFHFLEFFITAVYQPSTLTFESYLVNHSRSYTVAAMFSWLEFWIESFFLRRFKHSVIILTGIVLVLVGQFVRTLAMKTCGENFSHFLMTEKTSDHALVTSGIYSVLRHPSYFGWFYWSLGTQLILCNPVSFIGYTFVSWKFFNERIAFEEEILYEIYENSYTDYVERTYIGIPGIYSAIPSKKQKNE